MPEIGELQARLTVDTSGYKQGMKDAQNVTKKFNSSLDQTNRKIAQKQKQAGAQAGKNWVQAYSRELTALGAVLRFAGLGRVAEGIEISKNIGDTRYASSIGTGAAVGAGDLSGELGGHYLLSKKLHNKVEDSFDKITDVIDDRLKYLDHEIETLRRAYPPGLVPEGVLKKIRDLSFERGEIVTDRRKGQPPIIPAIAARGGLGLLGAAGLGLGLGAAGFGAFKMISAAGKRGEAELQQAFSTKAIIDEIESITDPVERVKAIIKNYGKDGFDAFNKQREEVEKLTKSMNGLGGAWIRLRETVLETDRQINWGKLFAPIIALNPQVVKMLTDLDSILLTSEEIEAKYKDKANAAEREKKAFEEIRDTLPDTEKAAENVLQTEQKIAELKERQLQAAKDYNKALADRNKASVDELAENDPLTRFGLMQKQLAQFVQYKEQWAKKWEMEGRWDIAAQLQRQADEARSWLFGATSSERNPMAQYLATFTDASNELDALQGSKSFSRTLMNGALQYRVWSKEQIAARRKALESVQSMKKMTMEKDQKRVADAMEMLLQAAQHTGLRIIPMMGR